MTGRMDRTWAALVLTGCAVLSLVLGGWVSLGRGGEEGRTPALVLAVALLGSAVAIAVGHPRTRLALGGVLVVACCGLIVVGSFEDFRFIWPGGHDALFGLEIVLAALGMTLVAPAYLVPGGSATGAQNSADEPLSSSALTGRELSTTARLALWAVTATVAGVVGWNVGTYAHVGDCGGSTDGRCAEATGAGIVGMSLAVLVVVITCAAVMAYRWGRRRRDARGPRREAAEERRS